MSKLETINYRKDIDGLRAIAVLAVILFHFGYLPNGYLGVDIFFVISGYLITKIVYNEAVNNRFSIINFYLRRIRRIIPLVLFTTLTALIIGLFVMLPDDLENLCQSVFATNFFANNILLLITTGNYWDIVNEYKPLMHTWSLGIEEQFYLIYPIIFLFLNGKRSRFILPLLILLTIISLILFILPINEASKFYSIQFRFFELSLGGIGSILFKDKIMNARYTISLLFIVLIILVFNFNFNLNVKLLLIVISSVGLLISGVGKNKFSSFFLENKLMVGIGKISFSLYMWHQIVLAYTRYFIIDRIGVQESLIIFIIILILSVFSYFTIEQTFRDKNRVKTKSLLLITSILFVIVSSSSYYLYSIGGIVRDVPELNLYKSDNNLNYGSGKRNIHIAYNAKIYDLDKKFTNNGKIKILIIGNSFARDFANILLESNIKNRIEISYIYDLDICKDINVRLSNAEYIFFSELKIKEFHEYRYKFKIDTTKVWNVGTKNFGSNNGIFYNKRDKGDYCIQKTHMNECFIKKNDSLKKMWKKKYIDLIEIIVDKEGRVPVFTSDCKFISQDCSHLTRAGAVFFAKKLDIKKILKIK